MKHQLENALQKDLLDSFEPLTASFDIPVDKNNQALIYLNGNSLGPKPKNIDSALMKQCELWGRSGVRAHFSAENPWISYGERAIHSLARLIGAKNEEVVVMGGLTANLHATFVSFYQPTRKRFKIIRLLGFPSDSYAIDSQIKQRWETIRAFTGKDPFPLEEAIVEIKPNEQGYIDLDTFKKTIEGEGEHTVLVWIEAVHYLTGQYFNIPEITHLAHKQGCKLGVDLAHAIANVPLSLHRWNVDFAVWCSYKYLSAGPGAIAGLYIHEKYLQDPAMPRFSGWWGHNKLTRFEMPDRFDPILTAEGWQMSNPEIFSLTSLYQALSLFDRIDFGALREKNKRLVAYLEQLLQDEVGEKVHIITPKNPDERGCQLSLRIPCFDQEPEIENLFFKHGIIVDVRGDIVRVAPMGLYTQFADLFRFVEKLKRIFLELS